MKNCSAKFSFHDTNKTKAYRSTVVFPRSTFYISISSFYYGIGNCDWIYLGSTSVQLNTTMLAYYSLSTNLVKWNFNSYFSSGYWKRFLDRDRYFVEFDFSIAIWIKILVFSIVICFFSFSIHDRCDNLFQHRMISGAWKIDFWNKWNKYIYFFLSFCF